MSFFFLSSRLYFKVHFVSGEYCLPSFSCHFPLHELLFSVQSVSVSVCFCLESLVGSILKVLGVCGVGDGEVRVIPGCEAELPLCSVAITNLSVVGFDSKLLEQKS